jgi:hypothetical protein
MLEDINIYILLIVITVIVISLYFYINRSNETNNETNNEINNETNLNKWNNWYKNIDKNNPQAYGDTITYKKGSEFLKDCKIIEDWGCGMGWFKQFVKSKYIGLDGSKTPHSDKKVDLTNYTSSVDGIFMRHILEHNFEWEKILRNACQSFTTKFILILFTPFSDKTDVIKMNYKPTVPDLSFRRDDITDILDEYNLNYSIETINNSDTEYNIEYIFYINK